VKIENIVFQFSQFFFSVFVAGEFVFEFLVFLTEAKAIGPL